MQTTRSDDLSLSAMIRRRHDPDEPTPATVADQNERHRLERRRRDERLENRTLWQEHYLTVAAALRRRADELDDEARELSAHPGEGVSK